MPEQFIKYIKKYYFCSRKPESAFVSSVCTWNKNVAALIISDLKEKHGVSEFYFSPLLERTNNICEGKLGPLSV